MRKSWRSLWALGCFFVVTGLLAGTPMWTFTPLTETTIDIPDDGVQLVQYRVANQSGRARTLAFQPIAGVAQITGSGVCPSPFTLQANASCILSLQVTASEMSAPILRGPVVCEQGGMNQCYQPSLPDSLNVSIHSSALSLNPNFGITAGGTTVTITGEVLQNTSAVTFGTTAATSFSVINNTTVTAVSPAHVAGVVSVVLTRPEGNVDGTFTYKESTLTGISPTFGSVNGGTSVTISGTNLDTASSVTFDGTDATSFSVTSSTTITAVTPAHAAGTVDVVVTTSLGTASLTGSDGYTYEEATLTSIDPSTGSTAGGTPVTLTGTDLTGTTAVSFDTTAVTVSNVTATGFTAVTPAHAAGAVTVTATTPLGTATLPTPYTYTDDNISISPTSGTAAGYTGVTISGNGIDLSTADAVTFGGTAATFVDVDASGTSLTAITPVHAVGTVDVVVQSGGSTIATLSSGYEYQTIALGQACGGGVIACLDGSGNPTLIAGTTDGNSASKVYWSNISVSSQPDAGSDTDGLANTQSIYSFTSDTSYAAPWCYEYAVDSQGTTPCESGKGCYAANTWFLPATDQLTCIGPNANIIGNFTIGDDYWVSTQVNNSGTSTYAFDVTMGTANVGSSYKDSTKLHFRCVRAYPPNPT